RTASQNHAPGAGDRGGRCAPSQRPFPSEIPRLEVFVWISCLPRSGRSDQACRLAASRGGGGCAANQWVPARAGTIHFGDRSPSSGGKVFRGVSGSFLSFLKIKLNPCPTGIHLSRGVELRKNQG